MPTAKLCFMLGEIASASHVRTPQQRDERGRATPLDEHRAEPLLPGDAQRGQAEGDEGVLAHVRRDRDRAVRVEPHQQRAEDRGQDRGHRARARRAGRRSCEDRGVDDDDVGHRGERRDPAQDLRARGRAALLELEEVSGHWAGMLLLASPRLLLADADPAAEGVDGDAGPAAAGGELELLLRRCEGRAREARRAQRIVDAAAEGRDREVGGHRGGQDERHRAAAPSPPPGSPPRPGRRRRRAIPTPSPGERARRSRRRRPPGVRSPSRPRDPRSPRGWSRCR